MQMCLLRQERNSSSIKYRMLYLQTAICDKDEKLVFEYRQDFVGIC